VLVSVEVLFIHVLIALGSHTSRPATASVLLLTIQRRVAMTAIHAATAAEAGTWLDGGVRTADELNAEAWGLAVAYGMPESAEDRKILAAFWAMDLDGGHCRWADGLVVDGIDVADALPEMGDQACDWLTGHVAPAGYLFIWDDGLILTSRDQLD
jgi:hypothetical protein